MAIEQKKHAMPTQAPDVRAHNFNDVALGYTQEMAVSEAQRCLNCKNMPCVNGCPVNIHIPNFISKIKTGMMSTVKSKIGALLVKPALKETLKSFDASNYGGAPLLGLNGLVVKVHGNSTKTEVCNAIMQCVSFKEEAINEKISQQINLNEEAI